MLGWIALFACSPDGVPAIHDPSRSEHYFDVPFPSDALLDANGFADLEGYPLANTTLANGLLEGWIERVEATSVGFGNNTPAYFRFAGPIEVPETTDGLPDDPFLWVDLDEPELLPLLLRFVEDPLDDPAYGANTLAMAPQLGWPPRAGHRYAAVVMRSAGVAPPEDLEVDREVRDVLKGLGVTGKPAIATVFTIQDGTAQLRTLAADVDRRLQGWGGDWGDVSFRRVMSLGYSQGETPSGNETTVATVTYEDQTTAVTYLEPDETLPPFVVDLGDDWPMIVYEAEIPVLNYQGVADRPFMSPGLQHVTDNDVRTGWIDFTGDLLLSAPVVDHMRITVSIPKNPDGSAMTDVPYVIYDHGTSGHAYNIVHRRNPLDDNPLMEVFRDAGFAVIGRDATLYGTRYPLIDEGYGGSLGFYNIVNAPAFRDNQRQTALEGLILKRYVEQQINDDLPQGSLDPAHARRMGHSLGSVTSNLGVAMAPDEWDAAFLSGTGGLFLHYFFDTGDAGDVQRERREQHPPAARRGSALRRRDHHHLRARCGPGPERGGHGPRRPPASRGHPVPVADGPQRPHGGHP
ncbi:MAG: hypothetical protein KC656_00110 [Myxococcales bacterium]|nr:hypothetical protein [Myxococcales bacterium]